MTCTRAEASEGAAVFEGIGEMGLIENSCTARPEVFISWVNPTGSGPGARTRYAVTQPYNPSGGDFGSCDGRHRMMLWTSLRL
jgi:hypothetical protein